MSELRSASNTRRVSIAEFAKAATEAGVSVAVLYSVFARINASAPARDPTGVFYGVTARVRRVDSRRKTQGVRRSLKYKVEVKPAA